MAMWTNRHQQGFGSLWQQLSGSRSALYAPLSHSPSHPTTDTGLNGSVGGKNSASAGWRQTPRNGTVALFITSICLMIALWHLSSHFAVQSGVRLVRGLPAREPSSIRGCMVMLVDPHENLEETVIPTLRNLEMIQGVWNYGLVLFIDVLPSEEIQQQAIEASAGKAKWVLIDEVHGWGIPAWYTPEQKEIALHPVGFSLGYRQMCRFFSGFAYLHPALAEYDWFWRIDTDSRYLCLTYDPIAFTAAQGAEYGMMDYGYDAMDTIPSLGDTVKRYVATHPEWVVRPEKDLPFGLASGSTYNGAGFHNNFEIVSRKWFASDAYQTFFQYLDRNATGFFIERWGDAVVRALAAALTLRPEQVAYFGKSLGYSHAGWQVWCPEGAWQQYCDCKGTNPQPNDLVRTWYDRTPIVEPHLPWQ